MAVTEGTPVESRGRALGTKRAYRRRAYRRRNNANAGEIQTQEMIGGPVPGIFFAPWLAGALGGLGKALTADK